MGSQYAQGLADMAGPDTLSRAMSMRAHLQGNFNGNIVHRVVDTTIGAFSDLWDGTTLLETDDDRQLFAAQCGLKDFANVVKYHGPFFFDEE